MVRAPTQLGWGFREIQQPNWFKNPQFLPINYKNVKKMLTPV